MRIRSTITLGSHLPVLIKIVSMTDGPILEMGGGTFSTPYLHWACFPSRKLVTYESYYDFYHPHIEQYKSDFHETLFVEDWDKIDISGHWNVVLIDHHPNERRKVDVEKLANSADYIILHDTEGRHDYKYGYSTIYKLFKYRYDFQKAYPFTTVLSNFKDLSNL